MLPKQRKIFALLLFMAVAVFSLFALPNAVASHNLSMIQMFEPDEAAPLPYVLRMIAPAENIDKALRAFIFYEYYYYGFPFFAVSALTVLPLQLMGRLNELPLDMLALRQIVSVLPMLVALLILVYLQDGFRSYRSPVLFAFLLTVPAVVNNNFWWHADSLTFLMVMLTFFFLKRDNLRFGRNFLLAAAVTGVVTATKLVGLYFFLAVGLTLVLGLVLKKASWQKLAVMSVAYIAVMALAFIVANPFLLSYWGRLGYSYTLQKQTDLLAQGYGIVYQKGLLEAWPIMHRFYGEALFLLVAIGAAVWGALRGPQRMLHGLILAWFLPLSASLLVLTHFKYQYWLPAALPLFSCLIVALPENWQTGWRSGKTRFFQAAVLLVALVQFALFLGDDVQTYNRRLHRAENNERIEFYDQTVNALTPLEDQSLRLYYDYRMYMPETAGWMTETNYELLEYAYIQQGNFDVLLLLEQRIRDYLNPGVEGIDPALFSLNQKFYRDADNETVQGYQLVYRNSSGLIYVRKDLYQQYFEK